MVGRRRLRRLQAAVVRFDGTAEIAMPDLWAMERVGGEEHDEEGERELAPNGVCLRRDASGSAQSVDGWGSAATTPRCAGLQEG